MAYESTPEATSERLCSPPHPVVGSQVFWVGTSCDFTPCFVIFLPSETRGERAVPSDARAQSDEVDRPPATTVAVPGAGFPAALPWSHGEEGSGRARVLPLHLAGDPLAHTFPHFPVAISAGVLRLNQPHRPVSQPQPGAVSAKENSQEAALGALRPNHPAPGDGPRARGRARGGQRGGKRGRGRHQAGLAQPDAAQAEGGHAARHALPHHPPGPQVTGQHQLPAPLRLPHPPAPEHSG